MSMVAAVVVVAVAAMGVAGGSYRHGRTGAPIALLEARRICATLCMSGLGGKACGEGCEALTPDEFPVQLKSNLTKDQDASGGGGGGNTRSDACPMLCKNRLGEPLCGCQREQHPRPSFMDIDFGEICTYYCVNHDYRLDGCRSCNTYRRHHHEEVTTGPSNLPANMTATREEIDWDEWCRVKCGEGDGGAACNCDILPLSAKVEDD